LYILVTFHAGYKKGHSGLGDAGFIVTRYSIMSHMIRTKGFIPRGLFFPSADGSMRLGIHGGVHEIYLDVVYLCF